ncbi:hypothetical protein jhhlp_006794 [Lomentospora prolificans]|uniref:Uncharacterized protein n=1 Tax=Lomentospora prolificans TaxID=41688 RepID=A0A2N3N2S1_9PEZI|nr:hypothetical protein jhhlp_006794 [Lomentospora prolificans]
MSREEYQIPTSTADHAPKAYGGPEALGAKSANLIYICGDCGVKSSDHQTVPFLRCKFCGCRILYKDRTKRMVQFEAR